MTHLPNQPANPATEAERSDTERLDWLAMRGTAVRMSGNGRRNLIVWANDYPVVDAGPKANIRHLIDAVIHGEDLTQEPRT